MAVTARGRAAIRPMEAADLRSVRRIERAAYGRAVPGTPFERELRNGLAQYVVAVVRPEPATDEPRGVLAAVRRMFGGSTAASERIVGFAGVWFTADQLHVVTVAVEPAEQGQGIGQELLFECHRLAVEAEMRTIALEVRVSNERAQRLYEWFGFKRVGQLRGYYSDNGEDAIVMVTPDLDEPAFVEHVRRLHDEHSMRFA